MKKFSTQAGLTLLESALALAIAAIIIISSFFFYNMWRDDANIALMKKNTQYLLKVASQYYLKNCHNPSIDWSGISVASLKSQGYLSADVENKFGGDYIIGADFTANKPTKIFVIAPINSSKPLDYFKRRLDATSITSNPPGIEWKRIPIKGYNNDYTPGVKLHATACS